MSFFYSFLIRCYGAFLHLAGVFNPKAKAWVKGRVNWQDNLRHSLPKDRKINWFHCASLGEFDQGLPLMNALKEKDPSCFLLVTFFSPSGMEHYQKRGAHVDAACYLPLDTVSNARTFIEIANPHLAVFVKYEFWPNFLKALGERNVNVIAISALFRPSQLYFKWYGGFFKNALKHINHFYVQNTQSAALLSQIGIDDHTVSGDLRFERVVQAKEQSLERSNPIMEAFVHGHSVLILGSSWPREEEIVSRSFSLMNAEKIIIAPHDIGEKHIVSILNHFPNALRYTHLDTQIHEQEIKDARVLVLDCIGLLSSAYRYGTIAFIGGGFSGSLHNILEPAVYGLPILFGPKHSKFPEAAMFLEKEFAREVVDENTFIQCFQELLSGHQKRSQNMMAFIHSQSGMAKRIAENMRNN